MRILAFWVAKSGKPASVSGFEFSTASKLGLRVEHIDTESYRGEQLVKQYHVNSLPTIIALSNAGMVLQTWSGYDQPTTEQLGYYIERGY
jgi:thioredoxin-related protein